MAGREPSEALRKELVGVGAQGHGPIASPDLIQFAPGLPKTRFGQDHAPHPAQDRRGTTPSPATPPTLARSRRGRPPLAERQNYALLGRRLFPAADPDRPFS